jgi:hypothetical protein
VRRGLQLRELLEKPWRLQSSAFLSARCGEKLLPSPIRPRLAALAGRSDCCATFRRSGLLARYAPSSTSPVPAMLDQAVLCDFIGEGHFGRHVRRIREVYAGRLSVLMESAQSELAGLVEISEIEAGLQTVDLVERWSRRSGGHERGRSPRSRGDAAQPLHAGRHDARWFAFGFRGGGCARDSRGRAGARRRAGGTVALNVSD